MIDARWNGICVLCLKTLFLGKKHERVDSYRLDKRKLVCVRLWLKNWIELKFYTIHIMNLGSAPIDWLMDGCIPNSIWDIFASLV